MVGFRLYITISLLLVSCLFSTGFYTNAAPMNTPVKKQVIDPIFEERLQLFQRMEMLYGIPWTYLAAIDQFERTMKKPQKLQEPTTRLTSIEIPPSLWSGEFNPEEDDTDLVSIEFFGGIGLDGDGDGRVDRQNDIDVLTTFIRFLSATGYARDDFRIGLWSYYQRDRSVKTIDQFAKVFDQHQTLALDQHYFPIPKRYRYSYNNTWGDARGWGGRRIHEGTDIFADYGTPVLSTGHGVVEVIGWNRYGGWRIGMRDMGNVYHYFAHLSSYKKGLKPGDIVGPGDILGYVGSSGYGKPGTSGKFPPHLHYGMYRDMGHNEWAFDPYPYLRRWERQMYSKKAQ